VAARIIIVGDVPSRPDRKAVLEVLAASHSEVEWEWIQAEGPAFNLPQRLLGRLLHELRSQVRTNPPDVTIVKLLQINGRDANALYAVWKRIVLAPRELATAAELVAWLCDEDNGLVPRRTWLAPVREAGMLALLAKLARNSSWNKDVKGHNWTKEVDLLGQAPVQRPSHPHVYAEALLCLDRASGTLLLPKGGSKTPKEWSINTDYLPLAKRALLMRSAAPIGEAIKLQPLYGFLQNGPEGLIVVDDGLVSERVLTVCRILQV
jgi:hypothetical protein